MLVSDTQPSSTLHLLSPTLTSRTMSRALPKELPRIVTFDGACSPVVGITDGSTWRDRHSHQHLEHNPADRLRFPETLSGRGSPGGGAP